MSNPPTPAVAYRRAVSGNVFARGRDAGEDRASRARLRTRTRSQDLPPMVDEPSEGGGLTGNGLDLSRLTSAMGKIDDVDGDDLEDEDGKDAAEDDPAGTDRITIMCTCAEFDLVALPKLLSDRLAKNVRWKYGNQTIYLPFSEALIRPPRQSQSQKARDGDDLEEPMLANDGAEYVSRESRFGSCLLFFCYGIVVMWGLTKDEEQQVLKQIVHKVGLRPLETEFVEIENFSIMYWVHNVAQVADDVLWMPSRLRGHVRAQIAVAHALAQSTKLGVFEAQGLDLLQANQHLPRELAQRGRFSLSRTALSKLIGRLFVHKSEVNLLSSVLDTPEYFWSAPDSLEDLFKSLGTYLEIDERVNTVKQRLEVIQEMFDMLQSRHDAHHGAVLEWVVIVLVALEFVVGVLEFCGTIGLIAPVSHRSLAGRIAGIWSANMPNAPHDDGF